MGTNVWRSLASRYRAPWQGAPGVVRGRWCGCVRTRVAVVWPAPGLCLRPAAARPAPGAGGSPIAAARVSWHTGGRGTAWHVRGWWQRLRRARRSCVGRQSYPVHATVQLNFAKCAIEALRREAAEEEVPLARVAIHSRCVRRAARCMPWKQWLAMADGTSAARLTGEATRVLVAWWGASCRAAGP